MLKSLASRGKMIRIIGPKNKNDGEYINTTSRSNNWSKGLSPFFVGPIKLWGDYVAHNLENAWQYSKVYNGYVDNDGNPSSSWFEWAEKGWRDTIAHRYPMPKGVIPLYSYWDGEHLNYVEARLRIYIPLYGEAVRKTEAFKILKEIYDSKKDITLWDFDGYDYLKMNRSLLQVALDPNRKMGHAFVLAMLLTGQFDDIVKVKRDQNLRLT